MKNLQKEIVSEVWARDFQTKELRHFGFIVGGIFMCIATFFYYSEPSTWEVYIGALGGVLFLGALAPSLLLIPYKSWLSLGLILGTVMSTVILTVLFYIVITPISLLKNVTHFITRGRINEPDTYWHAHPDTDWQKNMEEMS